MKTEVCCSMAIILVVSVIGAGGTYSGGVGTNADPYKISTVADWQELTNDPNGSNKHFRLINTIDFGGMSLTPVAPDTSTASGYQGTPFTGSFDGRGFVLRNAEINLPGQDFVGVFGAVGIGGKLYNLRLEGIEVTGRSYVGGLAGQNQGLLMLCYSTGAVSGSDYVGGLVGFNSMGKLSACSASGPVNGQDYTGGLAGYTKDSTIDSCYASNDVSGLRYVGGLVGWCNYGMLTGCYATGSVSGTHTVGGLVGRNYNSHQISASTAKGPVSGDYLVGGMVGNNSGAVTFSYSTGFVNSTGSYIGGFTGRNSSNTSITSCFWDTETSGMSTGNGLDSSTGLVGKTTEQMKTLATFMDAGWDFSATDGSPAIWKIPSAGGYPLLFWQTDTVVSSYSGGSGTEDDPYKIANVSDFQQLSIASGDWGKYFILTADIDLSDLMFEESPIAPDIDNINRGFQGVAFYGIFDGNNHTIKHLTISASDKDYIGLFGRINGGQIKNLKIDDAAIHGRSYVGGTIGMSCYGTTTDCDITGTVTGTNSYVGGFMGYNIRGGVQSCTAAVSVSGGCFVGGLMGYNIRSNIQSCTATGSVSGISSVGGLVGENGCGTITESSAAGSVTAAGTTTYCHAGGLVGWNSSGRIASCFSTADVAVTGQETSVGGIVGVLYSGEINSVYAAGAVTTESISSSYTGGLAGYVLNGSIGYSYSSSTVMATAESGSAGGLIGELDIDAPQVISCFWDIEASKMPYSAAGKGLTSQLMTMQAIFQNAHWANKGWVVDEGIDSPRLSWQNTGGLAIPLPDSIPLSGSGTTADPYRIYTVEEFAMLSWHYGILDKHLRLMNDLDLSGVPLFPIGDLGPFVGVFDGNEHTLRNVVIHQPGSSRIGLFGSVEAGGQIKI